MNESIMINQFYLAAFGAVLLFCLFCSVVAIIASSKVWLKITAKEHSTHTIEFRNPNVAYDDELDLNKLKSEAPKSPDPYDKQDIDGMNTFIKENDVII